MRHSRVLVFTLSSFIFFHAWAVAEDLFRVKPTIILDRKVINENPTFLSLNVLAEKIVVTYRSYVERNEYEYLVLWIDLEPPFSGLKERLATSAYPIEPPVATSPDGRFTAVATKENIRILDSAERAVRTFDEQRPLSSLAFSPDGKLLASVPRNSQEEIVFWNMETGQIDHSLPNLSDTGSIAFSNDQDAVFFSSIHGKHTEIWKIESGQIRKFRYPMSESYFGPYAYSPDLKLAAWRGAWETMICDMEEETEIRVPLQSTTDTILISPEKYLAIAHRTRIWLWDIQTNAPLDYLDTYQTIKKIALSQNGKQLVAVLDNMTIKVWERSENPISVSKTKNLTLPRPSECSLL